MKECNCGKIPPCYGSLEFSIYEEAKKVNDEWKKSRALHGKMIDKLRAKLMEGGFADATHDKVYELNKQMCDIDKHLSEAGYFGMICEGQIETRKKLIDMEEKKTKKMTKAEAFEWLKGKKVRCIGSGWNYCWDVLGKLQSFGLKWTGDWQKENYPIFSLFIDDSGRVTYLDIASAHTYNDYIDYVEVDLDDILSIEIVDENKKTEEEEALDKISCLGAQIVDILLHMKGHHHVTITETTVALYDEGMCLFHSDPF